MGGRQQEVWRQHEVRRHDVASHATFQSIFAHILSVIKSNCSSSEKCYFVHCEKWMTRHAKTVFFPYFLYCFIVHALLPVTLWLLFLYIFPLNILLMNFASFLTFEVFVVAVVVAVKKMRIFLMDDIFPFHSCFKYFTVFPAIHQLSYKENSTKKSIIFYIHTSFRYIKPWKR